MERLIHPKVKDMYLISPSGHVCAEGLDEQHSFWATYHATNGYDFNGWTYLGCTFSSRQCTVTHNMGR